MPRPPGRRVKCRAHSKRTGQLCENWAVNGWQVCRMHGARGGAPPEKLLANQNSLKHGAASEVAAAGWIRQMARLEPPVTPQAILRNSARTTIARISFVLGVWLALSAELDKASLSAGVSPGEMFLKEGVIRWKVTNGLVTIQAKATYAALWERWSATNEALNRLEAQLTRIVAQIQADPEIAADDPLLARIAESQVPALASRAGST